MTEQQRPITNLNVHKTCKNISSDSSTENASHQWVSCCRSLTPLTCYPLMNFCVYLHDRVYKAIGHHQLDDVLIAQVFLHVSESCYCIRDCRQYLDRADSEIPSSHKPTNLAAYIVTLESHDITDKTHKACAISCSFCTTL